MPDPAIQLLTVQEDALPSSRLGTEVPGEWVE